jgi:hypothetical protein
MSSAFGQAGDDLEGLCDAIAEALVFELSNATLISTHTSVYDGEGEIVAGSIVPNPVALVAAILLNSSLDLAGINWVDIVDVVATEIALIIQADATGTVTIEETSSDPKGDGDGVGSGNMT